MLQGLFEWFSRWLRDQPPLLRFLARLLVFCTVVVGVIVLIQGIGWLFHYVVMPGLCWVLTVTVFIGIVLTLFAPKVGSAWWSGMGKILIALIGLVVNGVSRLLGAKPEKKKKKDGDKDKKKDDDDDE